MTNSAQRFSFALLLALLALTAFTGYARRAFFDKAVTTSKPPAPVHNAARPETAPLLTPAQSITQSQTAVAGGGGDSAGGDYTIKATIGQNTLGTASGSGFALIGGFWAGLATAECAAFAISPAALPAGSGGAPYNQNLSVTGSSGAVNFSLSAGALPSGLQLSAAGLLSGTPTAFGTFNFTVRAADAGGCTGTRAYTLVICGPLALNPATLPAGTTGVAYNQTLSANSGVAPYSYNLSAGSLPAGLTLSAAGALAGVTNNAGTFNFTVAVTDALNCQGARSYTLTINPGAVAALTSLNPGFAIAGGSGLTLIVNGVNFASEMIVRWNGADRPTTFISSTELRALIPASDLTNNGRASITVFTPATGATTAALSFLVVNALANVSAASYTGETLAQEAIAAAFGVRLAAATQVATSVPLPTVLGGTSITVRDSAGVERLAPLFFVSAGQVNYQLPPGTAQGAALIYLSNNDGLQAAQMAQIAAVAPGLFTANANGQGVPAAVLLRVQADNTQTTATVARFDTAQNRFVPVPLDFGPATDQIFLLLFGTGIRARSALSAVTCSIGGLSARVEFAGQVAGLIGLDQLNVRLPRALAGRGEVDVVLLVDGKTANTVRVVFN